MTSAVKVATNGPGLYEFTHSVSAWLEQQSARNGLVTLFVQHTSCSLLIQENADPDVQTDLNNYFQRLVPKANSPEMSYLRHVCEGPDDMPAHIKASMLPVSLSIPLLAGRLALGTWQGLYLFEHRERPHVRKVVLHLSV